MKTNVLGYPRIGEKRELKKANEAFWEGNLTEEELLAVAENIRVHNWTLQKEAAAAPAHQRRRQREKVCMNVNMTMARDYEIGRAHV